VTKRKGRVGRKRESAGGVEGEVRGLWAGPKEREREGERLRERERVRGGEVELSPAG
jgi:hypothetical protein